MLSIPSTAAANPFAIQAAAAKGGVGGVSAAPPAAPTAPAEDPAVKEFEDYANLTPAQKLRAAILGNMGLKEDDLKAMDPKERQKIEDKIKALIEQEVKYGDKTHKGVLVDLMA